MEQLFKVSEIAATLFLGLVGFHFSCNYRRQVKQKTTEGRMESHARLWELTKPATPMRTNDWHEGDRKGVLTLAERQQLCRDFTAWYYEKGFGLFLGDYTRRIYLAAKHNLICPDAELRPSALLRYLEAFDEERRQEKRRSNNGCFHRQTKLM